MDAAEFVARGAQVVVHVLEFAEEPQLTRAGVGRVEVVELHLLLGKGPYLLALLLLVP